MPIVEERKMGKASDRELFHVNFDKKNAEKLGFKPGYVIVVYDDVEGKIILMNPNTIKEIR